MKKWKKDSRVIDPESMTWKTKIAICGTGHHIKIPPQIVEMKKITNNKVYQVTTKQGRRTLIFHQRPAKCSKGLHIRIPKRIERLYKEDIETEVELKPVRRI